MSSQAAPQLSTSKLNEIKNNRRNLRAVKGNKKKATEKENEPKSDRKISTAHAVGLVSLGFGIDLALIVIYLLHFIPVAGNIVSLVFSYMFTILGGVGINLWIICLGVPILGTRRAATTIVAWTVGLIPVLKMLPGWTLYALAIVINDRYAIAQKIRPGKTAAKRSVGR